MIDDGKLKIYAHATVEETKQNWASSDFVDMDKPDLLVTVSTVLQGCRLNDAMAMRTVNIVYCVLYVIVSQLTQF